MATIQASIEGALFYRLSQLVLTPALHVAGFDGQTYQPGATEKYLRVEHVPNGVERRFIGSTDPHRRYGLMQVMVVGPKAGVNPIDYTEIAGLVAAWFPADLKLERNGVMTRITAAPTVENRLDADPKWNVPVSIYYEAWA